MSQEKSSLTVTFIEFPATVDGRLYGKQSRDVYSFFRLPSRCGDLLAAIARRAGYADTVSLTPAHRKHGVPTAEDWRRLASSDVVGISVITRTAPPSYDAADRIRALNPGARIVFGGPHVSALPAEALRHGDVVVMNEGDHTLVEVLDRFAESPEQPYLDDVQGIAFRRGRDVVVNPKRPFLCQKDLDNLPFPAMSPYVAKRITHQTICTSRGCPFGCEYCSVIQNFGRGYRFVSVERSLELIRQHLQVSRAPIFFADDNFTANRKRTKQLLERCLAEKIRLPRWSCQSRVEAAFDEELLDLMKRTGLDTIMVGFESVNDETLALWNKASSLEKNREAIERFHSKGIFIHGMFVLGSDADTVETIDQTVHFAKSMNLDTAQFFAVTPMPGVPLTRKLEEDSRVLTREWHLYDAQHVVVRPARMTPTELQDGIARSFRKFYSPREGIRRLFAKSPRPVYNCTIRFLGRRLLTRVIKEVRPHRSALESLNDWLGSVDEVCSHYGKWLQDLGNRFSGAGADFSEALGRKREDLTTLKKWLIETIDERVRSLQDGLTAVGETYHPFCRQLIEDLRARFHSEAEAVLART